MMTISTDIIEAAARAAHEVNRAYCISLGDMSQPSWEDAPDWQKSSAIMGVKAIIANPSLTPRQSHESWLKEKINNGWVFGSVKDVEKKEHPCMVDYDDLPPAQKAKDSIFGAVVRIMLSTRQTEGTEK